jgi:hypothetical protein
MVGQPNDLIKVRMQAAETAPKSLRWHIRTVYSNWGIAGFYTGFRPCLIRALLLNATQMSTYDSIKHELLNRNYFAEGKALHFTGSFFAGIAVALVTSPMDVVKTRTMNVCATNPAYSGMLDCFQKILRTEGPLGLYKGVNSQWLRIGPLTMIQFMVWEQFRVYFGMTPI